MPKSIEQQAHVDEITERSLDALAGTTAVVFAYLFGSLARGTSGPTSDIDIAVYLKAGTDFAEVKLSLLEKLMDALGTDRLDLVTLNTAPLPLQARVIRCNRILVDREPHARHAFESLVLREYFDFSRFEEEILRRRFFGG